MNKINAPLCASDYGNSGVGSCFIDIDKLLMAVEVTESFVIREQDVPDLLEFLHSKIHAAIGTRIFPYPKLITLTDNTEDSTINTTEYGVKIFVKDGFYDWTFRYRKGGVQLHQEIAKNAGEGKYFIYFDKDTMLAYNAKVNGQKVLKGIPVDQFLVPPWRLNSGSEAALFNLRFIIDPLYLNRGNLGFLKVDFNPLDLAGLQDVELELANLAANVATVVVKTKIGGENLYNTFKTNLLQTAAWTAVNEDGNTVAIQTIADVPNTGGGEGGFAFTFNLGSFNSADKVYLKMIAPSVLRMAPIEIEGFENREALEIEAPAS